MRDTIYASDLIHLEAVLPSQIRGQARDVSPEHNFWLTILDDAVFQLDRETDDADDRQWFRDPHFGNPVSLAMTCDLLGFDLQAVQTAIFRRFPRVAHAEA